MHILSGRFKNHPLKAPKGSTTRPTTSKIRESLFNILQNQIENVNFLDLFAGSGAIGLEALSRGAQTTTFIEQDNQAVKCIRENIKSLDVEAKVLHNNALSALKRLAKEQHIFDIIFADPPYELDIKPILALIPPLLAPDGLVIIEQGKHKPFDPAPLHITEQRSFGDTILFFLNSSL